MKIQVNSDKSIAGHAELTTFVEGEVSRILRRFAARLTRVEVHLSDVDSTKSGPADKRCMIEVRPAGGQPRIASARASTVAAAADEAAHKMKRALTAYFGRMQEPVAAFSTPAPAARSARYKKSPPKKIMSPQAALIKPTR